MAVATPAKHLDRSSAAVAKSCLPAVWKRLPLLPFLLELRIAVSTEAGVGSGSARDNLENSSL